MPVKWQSSIFQKSKDKKRLEHPEALQSSSFRTRHQVADSLLSCHFERIFVEVAYALEQAAQFDDDLLGLLNCVQVEGG